jgi:hypothetical protein
MNISLLNNSGLIFAQLDSGSNSNKNNHYITFGLLGNDQYLHKNQIRGSQLSDQLLFFQEISHSPKGRQKIGIAHRPIA